MLLCSCSVALWCWCLAGLMCLRVGSVMCGCAVELLRWLCVVLML